MKIKIVSILLLVAMLFSLMVTGVNAAEEEEVKVLPPLGKYAQAVNTLSAIGIISGEGFDVSAPVTRGDFVAAAVKMRGIGDMLAPVNTSFSDVTAENINSGAIKAAVDMGIIKGFGDGTFRPDDTLKSEQAIKIIVSMLGYDIHTVAFGGYPVGYVTVGYTIGLLSKVVLGDGVACTWGDAAQIIYNALDTDLLQNVDMVDTYKVIEGENPLTKWLDMDIEKGIVSANKNTGLGGESCGDGFVLIGGESFAEGSSDISDMLGYKVSAYYKINAVGDKEILSYSIDKNTKIYEIEAEDVLSGTDLQTLVYAAENNAKKQLSIGNASFIYNKKFALPNADKLYIENGKITAVDNDGNGNIEALIIDEAEYVFVEKVNASNFSVIDRFSGEKLVFDTSKNTNDITIIYDGEKADFKKIKAKNVLTVLRSEDNTVITVYIGSKNMKGVAMEIDEKFIRFDDGSQVDMVGGVQKDTGNITLGEEQKFYLTYDGKIGGLDISSGEGKYGYLIAAAPEGKGLAADSSVTFRIFGTDGKAKSYQNDDTIFVNDVPQKSAAEIMKPFLNGGKFEHQLVRFVTNTEGKITKIFTAANNTAEPFVERETEFTLDYNFHYDKESGKNLGPNSPNTANKSLLWAKVDDSYGTFSNVVSLKGTICIKIPELPQDASLIDYEKEMQVVNNVAYFNRTSGTDYRHVYNLKAYDMNGGREASVIVFSDPYSGGSGSIPAVQHIMVDYVANTLDDEGYPTIKIYGFSQGGKVEYEVDTTSEQIKEDDLKLQKGDVIRVATSPDVIRIVKLFTPHKVQPASEMPPYSASNPQWLLYKDTFGDWVMRKGQDVYYKLNSPWYDEMGVLMHADVKGVTTSGFTFGYETRTKGYLERIFPVTANYSRYYVYDEAKDTIVKGSANDIDPDNENQTVVVRIQYNSAFEVFIYNWKNPVSAKWIGGY